MKSGTTNKWYFPWEKEHGIAVKAEDIEVKDKMKTKELIGWLNKIVLGNDIPRETQIRREIIERLKEHKIVSEANKTLIGDLGANGQLIKLLTRDVLKKGRCLSR